MAFFFQSVMEMVKPNLVGIVEQDVDRIVFDTQINGLTAIDTGDPIHIAIPIKISDLQAVRGRSEALTSLP